MKLTKILALVIALCMVLALGAMAADEVTWADYQAYLVEAAGGNAPDLDEFTAQVDAIGSWDEMPLDESPWDQLFSTLGISTWDEFVAAGGVGNMSSESGTASGEASDEASGEASGDTSEAAYQEYLKSYVAACPAVSDEQYEEFAALIDAGDYSTFPVEMCFTDTYWGFVAATYDEFVAAGGNVELPDFDPSLTQDAEA